MTDFKLGGVPSPDYDSEEFIRVLEVCDQMLEPHMIKYAELALTTDK